MTPAFATVLDIVPPPAPRAAEVSSDLLEFAEAIEFLTRYRPENVCLNDVHKLVALQWIDRAIQRLAERIERYLCPRTRINTEQQAMAIIRGVAAELKQAGEALLKAAQQFKNTQGQGVKANQTYIAAQRALKAAEELIG